MLGLLGEFLGGWMMSMCCTGEKQITTIKYIQVQDISHTKKDGI